MTVAELIEKFEGAPDTIPPGWDIAALRRLPPNAQIVDVRAGPQSTETGTFSLTEQPDGSWHAA